MRKRKMGFTVGQFRVLCLSTALAAFGALGQQALADGDTSKPLAPPPAARVTTSGSVLVDMSALDSVPNRRLLLPGVGAAAPATDGPVRLRPPPGVKPIAQAPIRLRPPPGVQVATPAPPKAPEAKPEAKMAAVTPAPTPPAPTPKAESPKAAPPAAPPPAKAAVAPPAPAAKAPVTAPAAAAPPPKAVAAAPAPAAPPPQKQTQVAVATPPPVAPLTSAPAPGQPRSLLTPPPAPSTSASATPPPAAATPAAAAPAKTEEAKPAEPLKETPKETSVAVATPPARTPGEPESLTISFKVGGADVPADATAGLKALAAKLAKDPTTRLQLIAYASDPEKSISRSRRLSLERAVNVRKVMLAAGIESTRIDIRALGEQSGSGAPDRVDAITVKR